MFKFKSLDDAYAELLRATIDSETFVSPRGNATRELSNVLLQIDNPRARFVTNPSRRWNLGLAFGELAWHLSGSRDVDSLAAYAKIWRRYSIGSAIRGSCYGHKIFQQQVRDKNQWEICKDILMNDISSRRAVIQLYEPDQNFLGSPDVSCAMSLQFVCRGGSLDLTVNMRSNDAYFGFPYDVFLYTNLQELMATELGVSVGRYCHFASSFHLYENDLEKARRVVSSSVDTIFVDLPLKLPAERAKFCAAESSVRLGDAGHNSIRLDDDFWHEKYLYLLEMHGGQPTRNVYADAFSH